MSYSPAPPKAEPAAIAPNPPRNTAEEGKSRKEISAGRWEWQQLSNAASCRFGQDSVLWTIIGSFWSTNAVLLVALGATGKWSNDPTLRITICGTGLLVSLVWFVMQGAALRRVGAYENVMKELESDLGIPLELRLLSGSDPEADALGIRKLPQARLIMPWGPWIATGGWFFGLVVAIAHAAD